ncbi:MAG: xanthine phosphoribosyltransferase [Bacilli bacterium]
MKELKERIILQGKILDGDVIKVGSFLNQQVDTTLLKKMALEVKGRFNNQEITKVLTIEASGIPFACAIAMEFKIPFVFAKKGKASNVSGAIIKAEVYSYTHKEKNEIILTKDYLSPQDKVLIADDFLANGEALRGLISLVEQCQAQLVGCVVQIEKAYQNGGNALRRLGYRIESLASIKQINGSTIIFN